MTMPLEKGKFGHTDTEIQRHRGECHMKTEAEMGVLHPWTKEAQGLLEPPATRRGLEQILPEASEGTTC